MRSKKLFSYQKKIDCLIVRVCGSYEAMESGSSVEGLIDMSGGIDEEFSMHDPKQRDFNSKEELKHFVLQADEHRSMIGCAIDVLNFIMNLLLY